MHCIPNENSRVTKFTLKIIQLYYLRWCVCVFFLFAFGLSQCKCKKNSWILSEFYHLCLYVAYAVNRNAIFLQFY